MFPASMRYGPDYHNAKQMQTALFKAVCDEKTPARDVVQCTRAWIELERFKREVRGIPPLAAASLKEMADYKHALAKQINAGPAFIDFSEAPATA